MEEHQNSLNVEEGWPVIQVGIDKLIKIVEGDKNLKFSSEEYMMYYTTVYKMSQPNPTGDNCQALYEKYKNIFEDYVSSKVLPTFQGKKDEALLAEIEKRWLNHKIMIYWLYRFFNYLNRTFVPARKVPSLQEVGLLTFYNLVFGEMKNQVIDAIMFMINCEREGKDIDQALLKNVLAIYIDVGEGSTKYYQQDFEEAMFKDTAAYYSTKASTNWIKNDSYQDYMLKVECCLKHERHTVCCYLQNRSHNKLLEIVEYELLSVYATESAEETA